MAKPRRLPALELTRPESYLVTIVTAARRQLLARLVPDATCPTRIGVLVSAAWERIPHHRPWVRLGAFVVMPDHLHGILSWERTPSDRPATISAIMNGFKAEATRQSRCSGALSRTDILWQRGCHVHRLLTSSHMQRATRYVLDGPARAWLKCCQQREAGHGQVRADGRDPAA